MVSSDAPRLTAKQAAVLDACQAYLAQNGFPPTRRELATALGYKSAGSVQFHLDSLARMGLISRDADRPRALRWPEAVSPGSASSHTNLPDATQSHVSAALNQVPLLHPGGQPSRQIALPTSLAPEGAVAVHTDEPCAEASILRGDLLVLSRRDPATHDLVALMEDDQVRVVRWRADASESVKADVLGVVDAVIRRV